ncbi:hypothetical protein KJZ67_05745 [Patescibacteria group bacterium]|nr:hypothetical protein [Patescibacteria group bacterium]
MNKAVDYLSWGFIAIFAAPTVLIMASWSSLPGDTMYGVKRSFEQTLLAVARPSYDAQASLNSHYTKRRLEEAKTLLASRQSSEGLSLLSAQVQATKVMIDKAPTVEKKREAAKQYITTLQGVSNELKAQQVKIRTRPTAKPVKRQFAPDTSAQQLQANLQMQLDQILALQEELQRQAQLQPQSQQLLAQLTQQAQQLHALQQQVAAQPANAPASAEIQAIAEQLSQSQQETEAIAEQITNVAVTPSSEGEMDETAITDVDDEIQEVIEELEVIASQASQPDTTEQEDGEDNGDQGRGNNRSNSDGNNQGRQDDNNDNSGNNNGDGGNSPDN